MALQWEHVAGPFSRLTEGPAWDGRRLLFTHIPESRIMAYHPDTGECTVYRENTNHTNGLAFDAEGRLYGCCSGGRSIVRFNENGTTTTIVDRLGDQRLNTPHDLAIDRQGSHLVQQPVERWEHRPERAAGAGRSRHPPRRPSTRWFVHLPAGDLRHHRHQRPAGLA